MIRLVEYALTVPIETNRGRGETRRIGSTRITFSIRERFEVGEPLRFRFSLEGGAEVIGWGAVSEVAADGEGFVVDASIDQTQINVA